MRIVEFTTLVVDPPWKHGDQLPGGGRGAGKHYDLLSVDEIRRFPLPPIAEDAWLFLWRVASMPNEALEVVRAWGFVPKAEMVWMKTRACKACAGVGFVSGCLWCRACEGRGWSLAMGMGRSVRNAHETVIIAKRGRPERLSASVKSVFFAERQRHSQKPEVFYKLVERLVPGPYVELFARRRRPGWTCMGLELPEAA